MKRRFFSIRMNIVALAGILSIIVLFSACKKNLDTVNNQSPVAGLMAFNLIPGNTAVGIALSGSNLLNSPLGYTNYTGGYTGVYAGTREVESYDYYTGSTLAAATQFFDDSSYYSVFVAGTNGQYSNIIVKDNLDSLSSTTGAFVRYVNAITDSVRKPLVNISSNGTNVFNDNAAFATVSNFKEITPGDIFVKVNDESAINANRTITLEKGKIYTVLLVGKPAATDSTQAVQIKYIQNGQVSDQ
jgi:hypothetical protein